MKFWKKLLGFFKREEDEVIDKGCCDNHCKHSLHIGINDYPGSGNDLRGCVNDATNWAEVLKDLYDFKTTTLVNNQATFKTVVKEMTKIITNAKEDHHIVITYSGHGTNVRDISGDESDKRDEALCLYDRLLIDDQLRKIFDKLPKGAKLTFISDSCHSGTVTRSFLSAMYDENAPRARYLPPEDDAEVFEIAPKSVTKKIFTPEEDMGEVLITGCNPTEYSYDARIGGTFQGAMTANAIRTLRDNPDCTYNEFFGTLRSKLPSRQYPQTPQLEGSKLNRDQKVFS